MESSVSDVKKGVAGTPGELVGNYNLQEDYGTLDGNTESGIFGQVKSSLKLSMRKPLPIAKKEEIKVGPAVILSLSLIHIFHSTINQNMIIMNGQQRAASSYFVGSA